jgi:hypothetical protein
LESIEERITPGVLSMHAHLAQTVATHLASRPMRTAHGEATKPVQLHVRHHHHDVVKETTRVLPAQSKAHHLPQPQNHTNPISSFFKSIFKGL